jgi:hypothetical protein
MLSPVQLNRYSQRFVERLLAVHPEWRALAQQDPEGFPAPGSLLIELPSPVASRRLLIRTYGNQITIDFGPHGWHEHFGPWRGPSDEVVFAAALAFIEDLLADRLVVVTRVFFGRPVWSRAVEASRVRKPWVGRVEVYSWSGARDATLGSA